MAIDQARGPRDRRRRHRLPGQRRRRPRQRRVAPRRRRHAGREVLHRRVGFSPLDHYVPLAKAADERRLGHRRRVRPRRQPRDDRRRSTRTRPTAGAGGSRSRRGPIRGWRSAPWPAATERAALHHERLRAADAAAVRRSPRRSPRPRPSPATGSPSASAWGGWRRSSRSWSSPSPGGASGPTRCSRCSRKLWAGGWVEHHGEFYDFDRLEMSPAPDRAGARSTSVGISEPALRRAARNDGWISDLHTTDELARDLRDAARATGRSSAAADEPFAVARLVHATPWDLDGYRRARGRRRDPPRHPAVGLLRRRHRRPRRPGRRHPPLRRRHHREVLTSPLHADDGTGRARPLLPR